MRIDGTIVNRASVHNVSIFKQFHFTKGCTCNLYKANMIIPQCDSVEDDIGEEILIPDKCPICGTPTEIVKNSGAGGVNEVQYACLQMMIAKATGYKPGKFTHFVANEQIYNRHVNAATELLNRANTQKLKISISNVSNRHYDYEFEPVKMNFNPKSDNFYDFSIEDFSLENYNPIKPNLALPLGI